MTQPQPTATCAKSEKKLDNDHMCMSNVHINKKAADKQRNPLFKATHKNIAKNLFLYEL